MKKPSLGPRVAALRMAAVVLAASSGWIGMAHAARPLTTDDADVIDFGACEWESLVPVLWAVPAVPKAHGKRRWGVVLHRSCSCRSVPVAVWPTINRPNCLVWEANGNSGTAGKGGPVWPWQ